MSPKRGITHGRVEPQPHTSLAAVDAAAEMLEQRMGRKERRSVGIGRELAADLLGHVNEPVDGPEEETVERFVDRMMLVGLDVVDLTQDFRMAVAACDSGDGTETRRHERRPILQQDEIGPLAPQLPPDPPPTERTDRIDAPDDGQIAGRRSVDRLALPGKSREGYCRVKVRTDTSSPRRRNVRAMVSMMEANPPR